MEAKMADFIVNSSATIALRKADIRAVSIRHTETDYNVYVQSNHEYLFETSATLQEAQVLAANILAGLEEAE
jgi:hypothetical protein